MSAIDLFRDSGTTILVDTHGRVIRSPETEAESAALKARIAELEATIKQMEEDERDARNERREYAR